MLARPFEGPCSPVALAKMASVDHVIAAQIESIDKQDSQFVAIIDNIVCRLMDHKLAWRMKVPPRLVGVHPANRGGYGVSAVEVHALGRDIVKMGWSPAATAHAACIEDGPDKSIAKFSVRLSRSTPGLGVVDESTIKYGSLACSHTNQFLVALLSEVESEHDSLTIAGRMSPAKVGGRDPKIAEVLQDGMTWLVLASQVAELYPRLPDLLQHARNATGAVQRVESEFAILSKIQSMIALRGSLSVDWTKIGDAVGSRTRLAKTEVATLLRFVQLYGGGDDGRFVRELDHFSKVFVPTGRVVPIATFAALTELKLAPAEVAPFFVSAVIKAQAACPAAKIANGICRFISSSDIASLAGPRRQSMAEAELVLRTCRTLVAGRKVNAEALSKALARLDTLMARFVLGKESKFESAKQLGAQFVSEVQVAMAAAGDDSKIESPFAWAPAGSTGAQHQQSSSGSSKDEPMILQYEADGSAKAAFSLLLRSAGFVDGSTVKNAKSEKWKISTIDDNGDVNLAPIDGQGQSLRIAYSEFIEKYQKASQSVENVANWTDRRLSASMAAKEQAAKAMVVVALERLSEEAPPKLRIQWKPMRGVFSEAAVGIGKLVLVPETTKIAITTVPTGGGLPATTPIDLGGKQVVLQPIVHLETVVPAWIMRVVDDPDVATMHIVDRTVAVSMTCRRKSNDPIEVVVPVFVNRLAVKVGEELTFFRAPVAKSGGKRQVSSLLSAALKKPKFE